MVTANKELLANFGEELFEAAETAGVDLLFEASVAGGIPLMRPLRESLAGERIRRVMGIVNGTTNYVLTRMTEERFVVRRRARRSAGARVRRTAIPTADIEGFDAAREGGDHRVDRVRRARRRRRRVPRGHHATSRADDIARRARARLRREAARASPKRSTARSARACTPRWCRSTIRSRRVRGSYNAVFIEGEAVGQLMLLGRGAGGGPTASAVLGDLIDAAKNLRSGARGATIGTLARSRRSARSTRRRRSSTSRSTPPTGPVCSPRSRACSATHEVSIQSMQQKGQGDEARLIFVTHLAREAGDGRDDPRGARARRGRAGRLGAARRRGRGVSRAPRTGAGIIEAYRDRLPVTDRRRSSRCTRATRRCVDAPRLSEQVGARVLPEGRGREPHRFVQGPRDDGRDLEGRRRRRQGRRVRVDRQHVGVGRRLRGAGRACSPR